MLRDEINELSGIDKIFELLWHAGIPPLAKTAETVQIAREWRVASDETGFMLECLQLPENGKWKPIERVGTEEEAFYLYMRESGRSRSVHYDSKDPIDEKAMTIRMGLEKMVCDCGVFDENARAIVTMAIDAIDAEADQGYEVKWDRPYDMPMPKFMFNMWFNDKVKPAAVKWAERCVPQAWWLPVFYPEARQKEMGLM
jgi:hypothetical protein